MTWILSLITYFPPSKNLGFLPKPSNNSLMGILSNVRNPILVGWSLDILKILEIYLMGLVCRLSSGPERPSLVMAAVRAQDGALV